MRAFMAVVLTGILLLGCGDDDNGGGGSAGQGGAGGSAGEGGAGGMAGDGGTGGQGGALDVSLVFEPVGECLESVPSEWGVEVMASGGVLPYAVSGWIRCPENDVDNETELTMVGVTTKTCPNDDTRINIMVVVEDAEDSARTIGVRTSNCMGGMQPP